MENIINFTITFLGKLFEELILRIRFDGRERAGFVLCNISYGIDSIKLIADKLIIPEEDDYLSRSSGHYKLKNEFINRVHNQAIEEGKHIIQSHSHPFDPGIFSSIDERTEIKLKRHIDEKVSGLIQASIVFSKDIKTIDSWFYNPITDKLQSVNKVVVVNPNNLKIYLPHEIRSKEEPIDTDFHDRTIRALGKDSLGIFKHLNVGVIGASGTGAITLEQLVRLGIENISICDPDKIDKSNLNRLQGTTINDVGKYKVKFYKNYLKKINPNIKIKVFPNSFYDEETQNESSQLDIIFICVDSGAVHSINQLAMANHIPVFIMNTGIEVSDEKMNFIGGQVFNIIPGTNTCVDCLEMFQNLKSEYLDPESLELERKQGYVKGYDMPDPSVYFLNMAIVSHGIWNFIQYALGLNEKLPVKTYLDMANNKLTFSHVNGSKNCLVCSEGGFLGKGDLVPHLVPDKNPIVVPDIEDKTPDEHEKTEQSERGIP